MRIELTTSSLPRRCSTTELPGHSRSLLPVPAAAPCGAGDRIRTGDVQLGRLTLYQLSYSREQPIRSCVPTGGGWWIRTTEGMMPADLQSAPFGHSGNPPGQNIQPSQTLTSWRRDSNPQPPAYKAGALPLSYASRSSGAKRRRDYPSPSREFVLQTQDDTRPGARGRLIYASPRTVSSTILR